MTTDAAWDVTCQDGLEYPRFDDADSLYVLESDDGEGRSGGWRMRPTDRGSMLSDVFTQLLGAMPAPRDPSVWEITRFVVRGPRLRGPDFRRRRWTAQALLREAASFAVEHRISRYVFVVTLAVERLIARSGLRVQRFASPVRIGRAMCVACWLDVDEDMRRRLQPETSSPDPASS